VGKTFKWICRS